jgi:pimeloyl-ACP methyl ester carboxylesterase
MKVAAARPDLLYAVVGMGQEVDRVRGEELSYRYVLEQAQADHNRRAVRELEELGGSDTFGKSGRFVERLWLLHYGGLVHSGGLLLTLRVLLEATEYSLIDCIRYARLEGTKFSIPLMSDELTHMNLLEEVPELTIPVFFFEGRHDHTAPSALAEEYYRALQAPLKRLTWFEESGHPPDFEEPEKFQRELLAIRDQFCLGASRPVAAEVSSLPVPATSR